MSRPACFFKGWPGAGPCDGALIRAHLIPRQLLKREFPYGAWWDEAAQRWVRPTGRVRRVGAVHWAGVGADWPHRSLRSLMDDENTWVPCCGGPMGVSGHHGMLDTSRKLRIPRERLPVKVEAFAEALGLGWYLDREYGERASAA